jgi:predicted O-linked N-acetylglucosamine transferase (SPINDLY family)
MFLCAAGDDILTKQKFNIKKGSFVYCSLSLSQYVDRPTLELWSSILKKTPQSILLMVLFSNASETALSLETERLGVKTQIRWTRDLTYSQLKRYAPHICDLYLDTLNYNDYTRISLALTFGIPVLTLSGDTMTTRITTSILYSVKMERELAATSKEK